MRSINDIKDERLEALVLGTLMNTTPKYIQQAREVLSVSCFYASAHRDIWESICTLSDAGEPVNLSTIYNWFTKAGKSIDVAQLAEVSESSLVSLTELQSHCNILADYDRRRRTFGLAEQLRSIAFCSGDELESSLTGAHDSLVNIITSQASDDGIRSMKQSLDELINYTNDMLCGKSKAGILTGFSEIDQKGGFLLSDLVVIAAKSSIGKTSMALTLAYNFGAQGYAGAIYSLEMNRIKLSARLMAAQSGLSSNAMLSRPLLPDEIAVFDRAVNQLYRLPIYFDDKNRNSIDRILTSIRRLKAKKNIKWAIVDYIQILPVNTTANATEEAMLGEIARKLKQIAQELNIVIVALSQLRKDSEDKPRKDRIRGSGQIEDAADTVILIYRPEMNERSAIAYDSPYENVDTHNTAEIMVAKGRNMGTFDFICGFNPEQTKFYQLSELPHGNTATRKQDEDEPF